MKRSFTTTLTLPYDGDTSLPASTPTQQASQTSQLAISNMSDLTRFVAEPYTPASRPRPYRFALFRDWFTRK